MSHQTSFPVAIGISLFALLLFGVVQTSATAADDAELQRIAGRFERTVKNEAGTEFRVVKDVVGDQSTVTTYDDVGQVVAAHISTIKVAERDGIRVLTFSNLKVTAGPDKGREHPAPQSYIYRLEGNNFAEAWGLLPEDKSPPRILYWKRVK